MNDQNNNKIKLDNFNKKFVLSLEKNDNFVDKRLEIVIQF